MIGIGGIAFMSVQNKIIASFLFSFGLSVVIVKGYNLYTGMIGYFKWAETKKYVMILISNIIGAFLVGQLAKQLGFDISTIAQAKLNKQIIPLFFSSFLCGILMYLGVSSSKKTNNPLYAILAVMIFILSGSEHCIANAFYFAATPLSVKEIVFFIVNIIGNSCGSILIHLIENKGE